MQRAVSFMRSLEERLSTRSVPSRFGTAFFHDELRYAYSLNFLRLDLALDPLPQPEELVEEVERIQGPAGLDHRRITVDAQAPGEPYVEHLRGLGWTVDKLVLMALHHPIEPVASPPVQELSWDEMRPHRELSMKDGGPWTGEPEEEEIINQLLDRHKAIDSVTNLRNFGGVAEDGVVGAYCDLYSENGIAQIEDVYTRKAYRKRGLADAVVRAAAASAEEEGCDLVFLVADDGDWPKDFYGRLGFDPIGFIWDFTRPHRPA